MRGSVDLVHRGAPERLLVASSLGSISIALAPTLNAQIDVSSVIGQIDLEEFQPNALRLLRVGPSQDRSRFPLRIGIPALPALGGLEQLDDLTVRELPGISELARLGVGEAARIQESIVIRPEGRPAAGDRGGDVDGDGGRTEISEAAFLGGAAGVEMVAGDGRGTIQLSTMGGNIRLTTQTDAE